jgi:uncharacterized protein YkwD
MHRGRSDDKETVTRKLACSGAALALLVFLLAAPGASASLIAPTAVCPNQTGAASAAAQQQAMRCMTDFARSQIGLGALGDSPQLDLSTAEKGADVLRCDSFSHTACGREFTYWMQQAGYLSEACWHVGENLAWGAGAYGTVRSIFRAWMRSPEHRRNILGNYEVLGLSRQVGELEGQANTVVWAAHFGSHCGTAAS